MCSSHFCATGELVPSMNESPGGQFFRGTSFLLDSQPLVPDPCAWTDRKSATVGHDYGALRWLMDSVRAGQTEGGPHTLRHTYATHLVRQTRDLLFISHRR